MSQVRRATRALQRRTEHLAEALRPARPVNAAPAAAAVGGSRLVASPVFVLSAPGSGVEDLRWILDRHPGITAPEDLDLPSIKVQAKREFTDDVMAALGLTRDELEHLLWDRVLHHELVRTGKRMIVDGSEINVLIWRRINQAWPGARFLFLTRETARSADHLFELAEAKATLHGLTISHEDLMDDREKQTRRLCDHLGVAWNPDLLG